MPNISFSKNRAGTYIGTWPGTTVMTENGPRKKGQLYLGKVIDREKLIFWNRKEGYFSFDPETRSVKRINPEDVPPASLQPDGTRRQPPVMVDFGDAYFLDCFLKGTGYSEVIDAIPCGNRDTLYAMIMFYVLEDAANCHAEIWYRHSFASYLYPRANVYSQRISDLLSTLGTPGQKRNFLLNHIEYVLSSTDGDVSILIDSTGLPNNCHLPVTRVSVHEGDVNIEFRMIALVQKSTGLPLYYEIIPGNIVDVSTTMKIMRVAEKYHCKVSYAIGDAGYCCPSTMEKLILSGIDFMTRMNPTYNLFPMVMDEHGYKLEDPSTTVRYRDRLVRVVKAETPIATNCETGRTVNGYVYLCKDMQSAASKQDHLMGSKEARTMTTDELMAQCARLGIFAIVTTRNLPAEEVLPEYYIRQNVEQYFDFGKNYAKFLPVRQQNMKTLGGHMLLAFIATFIVILIKNRLNILDAHYTEAPPKLRDMPNDEDESVLVVNDQGEDLYLIPQDPIAGAFRRSPSTLFYELRGQKAEVFDDEIIPAVPIRQAKDFYGAFRLVSPVSAWRREKSLEYEFNDGEKNRLTRKVAFSIKPSLSDEQIEKKRKKSAMKKAQTAAEKAGVELRETKTAERKEAQKRRPGRPKGSKNKSTLMREAAEAAAGIVKIKRKPGRPKGSKNKKTLEHEAEAAAISQRKKRGRPKGSKNKPKS